MSFELRVPCGSSASEQPGAAHALEGWLYKGAGGLPARELAAGMDDLGLQRGGGAGVEVTRLNANLLPQDLGAAFELYAKVLLEPHLEDADLESVLELARQDLHSLEDSPSDLAYVAFRARLYASRHRYPVQGTLERVGVLTPEAVRALRRRYTPQGATLAVTGSFDWDEVCALAQRHFGGWTGEAAPREEVRLTPPFAVHLEHDSFQTQIWMQYAGEHPASSDWYTFAVALSALSGGSSSRLFAEVREERGLAYAVSAASELMGPHGFLSAYAGCTPENAPEAIDTMRRVIEGLRAGLEEDELERAKVALRSSVVQSGESARARCGALGRDLAWLGRTRTLAEIEAAVWSVTLEQVNAYLARRPFETPSILTLGPGPAAHPITHALQPDAVAHV